MVLLKQNGRQVLHRATPHVTSPEETSGRGTLQGLSFEAARRRAHSSDIATRDVKNNLSLEKILSGTELWFKQEGQVHGKVCAVVASRTVGIDREFGSQGKSNHFVA